MMTAVPRHRQTPISIRSDRAARALARLAGDGRSQAQIIEEALDRIEPKMPVLSPDDFYAEIAALVRPLEGKTGPSFKEFDDQMWDEHGLPR